LNKPIIESEFINLKNLFSFILHVLRKYSRIFLLIFLVFTVYFFVLKTPSYSSKVSFYTNYNEGTQSSALSFIRSFTGDRFAKALYLGFSVSEYLNSEKFLQEIVEKKYNIEGNQKTLVDHWGVSYNDVFSLNPFTFVKKTNRKFNLKADLSVEQKKLILAKEILRNSINHTEDKVSSLNEIIVTARKNPELSQQVLNNIYDSVVKYSWEITNTKAKEKRAFVAARLAQAEANLEKAENELILFLKSNKNLDKSPLLNMQRDRIKKDITLYNQLSITLADQLEIAKINEQDNTSTIFLLDAPYLIPYKAGSGFLQSIISLFIIFSILLLFYESYNKRDELFL